MKVSQAVHEVLDSAKFEYRKPFNYYHLKEIKNENLKESLKGLIFLNQLTGFSYSKEFGCVYYYCNNDNKWWGESSYDRIEVFLHDITELNNELSSDRRFICEEQISDNILFKRVTEEH